MQKLGLMYQKNKSLSKPKQNRHADDFYIACHKVVLKDLIDIRYLVATMQA